MPSDQQTANKMKTEIENQITIYTERLTRKEWKEDFWNNPSEFPNDNSLKSNLRLLGFETAEKWFELIQIK